MKTTFYENRLSGPAWEHLYNSLKTTKNPNVNELQQFLKAPYTKVYSEQDREQYHHQYMDALQLKLKAMKTEPSPMEKTMTRSQLFLTNSPLWTNDMAPKDIVEIVDAVDWLKKYGTEHQILNMFDNIINFEGNVDYLKLNELFR